MKIQSSKVKLSNFSCNGGELFNKICAESETVDERQIARFMGQICKAFTYIHSKNIIHLDLKVSGPKEAQNSSTFSLPFPYLRSKLSLQL